MECEYSKDLFNSLKHHILWMLGVVCFFSGTLAYGVTREGVKSQLHQARETLRVSEATEARISLQLERLQHSENVSPEAIRDYETYLDRVHRMVLENRKVLAEMEAAFARHGPMGNVTGSPDNPEKSNTAVRKLPEAEVHDEVAVLDGEFHASLVAFDEMLLKELDEIRMKSANRMQDLAHEAASAAQRVRNQGVEVDTSYQENGEKTEDRQKESEVEKTEKSEGEQADFEREKGEPRGEHSKDPATGRDKEYHRAPGGGKGGTYSQKEKPARSDDDIVARQIREAAENETDPELKERLWKEYENYKKGKSR
jgi:hypothetical protein